MKVLLVRHSISEANNKKNAANLAFNRHEAPLTTEGRALARVVLGNTLRSEYGIRPDTPVAVSELRRAQETAKEAGLRNRTVYPIINEAADDDPMPDLHDMLRRGELPNVAITAAMEVLQTPPPEGLWVTHGLVIAGLCRITGQNSYDRLIPQFCEVRELDLTTG